MNPRNLNVFVERAITQSRIKNTNIIKVLSSNWLKSGDLSIETATSTKAEALKQFADKWVDRVGNRAAIQITTYGIIPHSTSNSIVNIERFEDLGLQILLYNKPFIPQAEIKYVKLLMART